MSEKLLLIINPYAGKRRVRGEMFNIVDVLSKQYADITVHLTTKQGDAMDFVRTNAAEYDKVVCCGGDGTLNEVINGVMAHEKRIPIGYIPTGSTNDFASTMKIPSNIKKAAAMSADGTAYAHDVGLFNDERHFSYIASLGAFTKTSYSTSQKLKNQLGHAAYILEAAKSLGDISPFAMRVETADYAEEGKFLLGAISNSTSIGGVFKMKASEVIPDDGEFEVVLVRHPKNTATGYLRIVQSLLSQKYDPELISFFRAKEINITTKEPLAWTLDGESGGTYTQVNIKNLHKAIDIIHG